MPICKKKKKKFISNIMLNDSKFLKFYTLLRKKTDRSVLKTHYTKFLNYLMRKVRKRNI